MIVVNVLLRKMKVALEYPFGNFFYFLSAIIFKSNKVWIFGAWGGNLYADNPKYLFEYINSKHKEIDSIWLSRNEQLIENLRNKNFKAYKINSVPGLWYCCRASIAVISHGMIDVNRYACARLKIVQTWHGIPMKPVLLSDPKQKTIKKRKLLSKLSFIFPFLKKELDYENNLLICSSSTYVSTLLKQIFGKNAPLVETGFPRLDGLFQPDCQKEVSKEIITYQNQGLKVGIYMPTYRSNGEFDIIDFFTSEIDSINEGLVKNEQVLYLKIHPFDFYKLPKSLNACNIHFINDEHIDGDIYEVLGLFDFLITDYSSVVFDYLVLTKPVFFLVPDRESYVESNGAFVFDYEQLNLPVFTTWVELLAQTSEVQKFLSNELQSASILFHQLRDYDNSKRLYNEIIKKL